MPGVIVRVVQDRIRPLTSTGIDPQDCTSGGISHIVDQNKSFPIIRNFFYLLEFYFIVRLCRTHLGLDELDSRYPISINISGKIWLSCVSALDCAVHLGLKLGSRYPIKHKWKNLVEWCFCVTLRSTSKPGG